MHLYVDKLHLQKRHLIRTIDEYELLYLSGRTDLRQGDFMVSLIQAKKTGK